MKQKIYRTKKKYRRRKKINKKGGSVISANNIETEIKRLMELKDKILKNIDMRLELGDIKHSMHELAKNMLLDFFIKEYHNKINAPKNRKCFFAWGGEGSGRSDILNYYKEQFNIEFFEPDYDTLKMLLLYQFNTNDELFSSLGILRKDFTPFLKDVRQKLVEHCCSIGTNLRLKNTFSGSKNTLSMLEQLVKNNYTIYIFKLNKNPDDGVKYGIETSLELINKRLRKDLPGGNKDIAEKIIRKSYKLSPEYEKVIEYITQNPTKIKLFDNIPF